MTGICAKGTAASDVKAAVADRGGGRRSRGKAVGQDGGALAGLVVIRSGNVARMRRANSSGSPALRMPSKNFGTFGECAAITSNPHVQLSETKSPQAGFDRESHRVAAAAFGAKKVDPSPVDAASQARGRILPSLVADEPLRRPLRDAALTTAESEPPSRAPKRGLSGHASFEKG